MKQRHYWIALIPGAVLIFCFAVAAALGYRLNMTASLPMGVWQETADVQNAVYVEFCLPEGPVAALARERGYVAWGKCPSGLMPLLKPVVARAGDLVVVTKGGLSVNGRQLLTTGIVGRDTKGRPLPVVQPGSYRVAPGFLWVLSTHHPHSFDSRHYGPISQDSVIDGMRPVMVSSNKLQRDPKARLVDTSLIEQCAPTVAPATMQRIVKVESGFKPHVIGYHITKGGKTFRLTQQPKSTQEAVSWAQWLLDNGYRFDAGAAQVNSNNFSRLGLNAASVFEPCANIRAGGRILTEFYQNAERKYGRGQEAVRAAISAYQTGSFTRGYSTGYVERVAGASTGAPKKETKRGRANSYAPMSPQYAPVALAFE